MTTPTPTPPRKSLAEAGAERLVLNAEESAKLRRVMDPADPLGKRVRQSPPLPTPPASGGQPVEPESTKPTNSDQIGMTPAEPGTTAL